MKTTNQSIKLAMASVIALSQLGACDAAESGADREVLRTANDGTEVVTVERADRAIRTTLFDVAGDERAVVTKSPDDEASVTLDGEPWAQAGLGLLELEALHETLHDVGSTLGDGEVAAGKADGASDPVVPGFYWRLPEINWQINSCRPLSYGLPDGTHEYTGEVLDWYVASEIHDVTAEGYVETRYIVRADGSLYDADEDGVPDASEEYQCQRAGAVFAYCTGGAADPLPTGIQITEEFMHMWDRPGGGFRRPLVHAHQECIPRDVIPFGQDEPVDLCEWLASKPYRTGWPCDQMYTDAFRPTDLPLVDLP